MLGLGLGPKAMGELREGWTERERIGGGGVKGWGRTGHNPKDRRKAGAFTDLRPAEVTR